MADRRSRISGSAERSTEDLPTLLVEDEVGGSASQDVARVGVRPAHAVSGNPSAGL
jgi:hypothetical protein